MSDERKDERRGPIGGESALGQGSAPQWETVKTPVPPPVVSASPYPNQGQYGQQYPGGYPPPAYPQQQQQGFPPPPQPPQYPQQPGYGAPVYGGQAAPPPPGGWPVQPMYGQSNYSQPDYAELAAVAMMASGIRRRRRRHHFIIWPMAILLVLFFMGFRGCMHFFGSIGENQIVPLHDEMKQQDYAGIFEGADPAYQQSVGRQKSDAMFRAIHMSLGDPKSFSTRSVSQHTAHGQDGVKTLVVLTKFEHGTGTETMRFHEVNGVWKLAEYNCESPKLGESAEQTF